MRNDVDSTSKVHCTLLLSEHPLYSNPPRKKVQVTCRLLTAAVPAASSDSFDLSHVSILHMNSFPTTLHPSSPTAAHHRLRIWTRTVWIKCTLLLSCQSIICCLFVFALTLLIDNSMNHIYHAVNHNNDGGGGAHYSSFVWWWVNPFYHNWHLLLLTKETLLFVT